jgi:hypothetical protein
MIYAAMISIDHLVLQTFSSIVYNEKKKKQNTLSLYFVGIPEIFGFTVGVVAALAGD